MITPVSAEIKKTDLINFFDDQAQQWDNNFTGEGPSCADIASNPRIQNSIKNASVLNVGCGTGAFTQALLDADCKNVTGIDLSKKMIEIARSKFNDNRCKFIVSDIMELEGDKRFDIVVMYNVYPHIPNKRTLIYKVYELLHVSGRFLIAHGASRQEINSHHKKHAKKISTLLEPAQDVGKMWSKKFDTDLIIDDSIYVVSGTKLN